MDGAPVAPADVEYSAALGERLAAWRTTYYFDLAGFREDRAPGLRDLAPLIARVADALSCPDLTTVMSAFDTAAAGGASADQLVLGIDERDEPQRSRVKIYLVVRRDQPTWLSAAAGAVGLVPARVDLETKSFFILGVDLGHARDLKLYTRIEGDELAARVSDIGELAPIRADSRALVFRECIGSERSQIIFEVVHPRSLTAFLARRSAADARFAELSRRVAAMSDTTTPTLWLPRLAAFPLRGGALDAQAPSLYFHPSLGMPREPPNPLD
jgi:hypothetical protein